MDLQLVKSEFSIKNKRIDTLVYDNLDTLEHVDPSTESSLMYCHSGGFDPKYPVLIELCENIELSMKEI